VGQGWLPCVYEQLKFRTDALFISVTFMELDYMNIKFVLRVDFVIFISCIMTNYASNLNYFIAFFKQIYL
jgi:hypothetical protein